MRNVTQNSKLKIAANAVFQAFLITEDFKIGRIISKFYFHEKTSRCVKMNYFGIRTKLTLENQHIIFTR